MLKITVVISTYNYGKFLQHCLDSILSQTRKADQIIVINDCSTDNTAEVIKRYSQKITYLAHKKRLGNLKTYNEGIKRAGGDYIIFINADDWLTPRLLEKEAAILDKYPQIGLVYAHSITVSNGRQELIMPKPAGKSSYIGRKEDFYLFLTCGNFVPGNTALVRKAVFEKVGQFNVNLPTTADYEMWMRIAKSYPLAYIAEPLAYYRIHDQNLHFKKDYYDRREKEVKLILAKYLQDQSIPKSVANLAYYKYLIGVANRAGLSSNLSRAKNFWFKAVRKLPFSIHRWSTWQPFYFYIRNLLVG